MDEDYSRETNRRRLLAALGTGATGFLAGCSGGDSSSQPSDDDNGANNPEPGDSPDNGNESSSSGNGGNNNTEPRNDNGTDNGGNNAGNGEPEDLLQVAKILDGQNQELNSLTLGDGENATTNAEIYINAEADTQTTYNAEITYSGEEPDIAEEIEQILDLEGEIQTSEQPTLIGEISYEQIKQQVDEEINAEIEIYINAEADTQTTYNAEITYSGEEPDVAEEIEQLLNLEGEIQTSEQPTLIGEISYEQIKEQVEEEINAEIEVTVEAGETGEQETVNLPLTLKEQSIDFEELRQRHRQNRQDFLRFVPQIQGKYEINYRDIETMRKIAEEHDVETDPKSDIFYDFLHQQDESLEGLNYSDTISSGLFTMQDPENPGELIGVNTFVFEPEIDSFESFREGNYFNSNILSHGDYPHQVSWISGSDFPEVFIDVLENEHPDLNQEIEGGHSDYSFKETEAYQEGILFNFGNSPRTNSLFEQDAVKPSDINAFRYHKDGTVTDEVWKWNEESQEYELEYQLERSNIGETLFPLTPQIGVTSH